MKAAGIVVAMAVAAGGAQASEVMPGQVLTGYNTNGGGGGGAFTTRSLTTLNINVTGITSSGEMGDPLNIVSMHNIGADSHVVGIGWDVTLVALSPSRLEEMNVLFTDSGGSGVYLTPGAGDAFSGTKAYSSGGIVSLTGIHADFSVGADGLLRVEYWETIDSLAGRDGIWQSGTLSVQYETVPAPAAAGVLGAGGLLALRRRR